MNKNIKPQKDLNQDDSFVLISSNSLKRLEDKLDSIYQHINGKNQEQNAINGYLSEKQAMEKFKRSHTWFWEKRRSSILKFSKIGKTIYYKNEDLLSLIQSEI